MYKVRRFALIAHKLNVDHIKDLTQRYTLYLKVKSYIKDSLTTSHIGGLFSGASATDRKNYVYHIHINVLDAKDTNYFYIIFNK